MLIRVFKRLGVQSKVVAMVLVASLLSLLLTGLLSYGIGRQVLTQAATNQLVGLRNTRAVAIQNYFSFLNDHVLTLGEAAMTIDGIKEFKQAYNKLGSAALTPEQTQKLNNFYVGEFLPKLSKNIEGTPSLATYLPDTPADKYLTYNYTASVKEARARKWLDDPKDGSEYSKVHKTYHYRFRRIADVFEFTDVFLVDIDTGNVLYSVVKEADFGTDLKTGPFSDTALAKVYDEVRKSRDPNFVYVSDIEHYKPSFGAPAFFIGTTVFDGDDFIGALIYQISPDAIDRVMTDNRQWEQVGLGKTGESFLVAQDSLLRSSPREFLQNPENYFKILRDQGVSKDRINWIKRTGSPVLIQSVKTEAAQRALTGKTGEVEYIDYRGKKALASYQPVRFGSSEWGLVAKMDKAELLKGVRLLRNALMLLGAILIPLLTLLSLGLARSFIQPIQRLIAATKEIAAGSSDVKVRVDSSDEFGELSHSFNDMADTLSEREQAIKAQLKENDRLLLNILPAKTAERLKQGEESIAETYPSVTVLYADLEGFQALSSEMSPDQAIEVLNELVGAFDDAAERWGVEKLRSTGSNYLAVCGLSVPRVDDEKRTAELALEMLQVVERLGSKHAVDLSLDIGIHSGALAAGVVGKSKFYYDVWGETMNIARAIHVSPKQNVIQVTDSVVNALTGMYHFEPLPPIVVKGEPGIPIWELTRLPAAVAASPAGESA